MKKFNFWVFSLTAFLLATTTVAFAQVSASNTPGSIPIRIYDAAGRPLPENELYNILFRFYRDGREIRMRGAASRPYANGQLNIENVPAGAYTLKAFFVQEHGGRGDHLVPSSETPLSPGEHTVTVPPGGAAGLVEFRFKG